MAPKARAQKRKAEETNVLPNKESKTEAKTDLKSEANTEAKTESKTEKEKDAVTKGKAPLKSVVSFNPDASTLNVLPTMGGKLLMALNDSGMQYLIAGARANVGINKGRYMFECKIVEQLSPVELPSYARIRGPLPRQIARVGFSVVGSDLVLSDGGSVYFDADGSFVSEGKVTPNAGERFTRDQVIAVVLNLDAASPNKNTVSLFRDGERVSEPMPLPEALIGKPLYPHVSFRSVSVQVNFGTVALKELPFKCLMLQSASTTDVEVPKPCKPEKNKLVFPVGIPDEGIVEWTDRFLAQHPEFLELSDRSILQWATKSGIVRPAPMRNSYESSNDKPEFNTGVHSLDDFSIRKIMNSLAPVVPRNYLILEIKGNLTPEDRAEQLRRFGANFKRIAHVAIGKPDDEFRKAQQEQILKNKQAKATEDWRLKKAEINRKKQLASIAAKTSEAKVANEQGGEDSKKDIAGDDESKEKQTTDSEGAAKEEELKVEVKDEVLDDTKEIKKEEEHDAVLDEPPTVELTDEEKKILFIPKLVKDLSPHVLSKAFSGFKIPTAAEGFDDITFQWDNEASAQEHLSKYLEHLRLTTRVDDVRPGQWFKEKQSEWMKTLKEWQALQNTNASKTQNEESEKPLDNIDVFSVENILDIGNGKPLFSEFAFQDWVLVQLRFELHLLAYSFSKDADGRKIVEKHFDHYYAKYFQRSLSLKMFGVESKAKLFDMLRDCISFAAPDQILESSLSEETGIEMFVKLQEDSRRTRQRHIDAGCDLPALNFHPSCMQQRVHSGPYGGAAASTMPRQPGQVNASAHANRPGNPRVGGTPYGGGRQQWGPHSARRR
eukprot:TRINITY_DN5372_c0_g1_i1.p1 TRINITY_DN5372_c0_g1~~TRINITY_DN5372_c0_g1_i1.p1  ORF type:complete len:834 (-),score=138.74 TRINITY_DN5372_c0_g1_i1:220-2721(-)